MVPLAVVQVMPKVVDCVMFTVWKPTKARFEESHDEEGLEIDWQLVTLEEFHVRPVVPPPAGSDVGLAVRFNVGVVEPVVQETILPV